MARDVDLEHFSQLYHSGTRIKDIPKLLGISSRTVSRVLTDLGLQGQKRTNLTPRNRPSDSLLGKKFNHLTVVGFAYSKKCPHWRAVLRCDCGRPSQAPLRSLKLGIRKTCGKTGCPHFHALRVANGRLAGFTGYKNIYGCRWAAWRIGAAKRGIDFKVTPKSAWTIYKKQHGFCALSGEPISFGNSWNKKGTASLDRIDSSKGYTLKNIQWVHKRINIMKMNTPEDEFYEWCRKIYRHLTKQRQLQK